MNIEKAIYNLQRIQILQTKINSSTSFLIPDDYAYAWNVELYPLFGGGELHEQYQSFFKVSREEVDIVTEFADSEWLKKEYYTFYQYEDLFVRNKDSKIKTDRWNLIAIFRYMYLRGTFDTEFWSTLVKNGECPIEAFGIVRDFDVNEISII